jgi:hypothetical protein
MFRWDRTPPPEWVRSLRAVAPPGDRVSHLVTFWEPGTPKAPVQRWVLYQAVPARYVPPVKWALLFGERPETTVNRADTYTYLAKTGLAPDWTTYPDETPPWVTPGRSRTFRYLCDTGCLAQPWWVIQGDQGGHRYQYSQTDQMWARLRGEPDQPSPPGDLAYAPPDNRVLERIRRYDLAHRAYTSLGRADAADRAASEQSFRAALTDYMDDAVDAAIDALPRAGRWDDVGRRYEQDADRTDYEWARDQYITTGRADVPATR